MVLGIVATRKIGGPKDLVLAGPAAVHRDRGRPLHEPRVPKLRIVVAADAPFRQRRFLELVHPIEVDGLLFGCVFCLFQSRIERKCQINATKIQEPRTKNQEPSNKQTNR